MKFTNLFLACCTSLAGCSLSSALPPSPVDIPRTMTPEILAQCPDFTGTFEDWDSSRMPASDRKRDGYGELTNLFCAPIRDPNHQYFGGCMRHASTILFGMVGPSGREKLRRYALPSERIGDQPKRGEKFKVTIRHTNFGFLWLKYVGDEGGEAEGEAKFFINGINTCKNGVWIQGSSSSLGGTEGSGSAGRQVIQRLYRDPKTGDFIHEFESISVPRNFFGAAAGEPNRYFSVSRYTQVK